MPHPRLGGLFYFLPRLSLWIDPSTRCLQRVLRKEDRWLRATILPWDCFRTKGNLSSPLSLSLSFSLSLSLAPIQCMCIIQTCLVCSHCTSRCIPLYLLTDAQSTVNRVCEKVYMRGKRIAVLTGGKVTFHGWQEQYEIVKRCGMKKRGE